MQIKRRIINILLVLTLLVIIIFTLYNLNYLEHKKYSNNHFNITTYKSNIDKDNDNIDDQTDILNNAKSYINKKPKYKSKYYNTGYPDDNYGVCSDVVAFSLKNAGYDLMELVDIDINNNKEKYNIETIDKNIDFRRVKNLQVYFENNSISLTTNINDIDKWQGGDIIIFKNHIGIISNNRNKKGIPFVIHHYSPYQINYEEDIFEKRNDIVGHYRIS